MLLRSSFALAFGVFAAPGADHHLHANYARQLMASVRWRVEAMVLWACGYWFHLPAACAGGSHGAPRLWMRSPDALWSWSSDGCC